MSFTKENLVTRTKSIKDIEDIISKAIKKVNGTKENDLCKYIPVSSGGYIHHFTLRKMKHQNPSELLTMIEKFIINANRPVVVPPKQRAARGSRKKRSQMQFNRNQLERLLNMARLTGDKEMIFLLSPKRSLSACKRDLISAVRRGLVEQELWNAYVDAVQMQSMNPTEDK